MKFYARLKVSLEKACHWLTCDMGCPSAASSSGRLDKRCSRRRACEPRRPPHLSGSPVCSPGRRGGNKGPVGSLLFLTTGLRLGYGELTDSKVRPWGGGDGEPACPTSCTGGPISGFSAAFSGFLQQDSLGSTRPARPLFSVQPVCAAAYLSRARLARTPSASLPEVTV